MKKNILLALVFILVPVLGQAKTEKMSDGIFEVDGYQVEVSAQQRDGEIVIRGRISYGPYCNRLNVKLTLVNEKGDRKTVTTEAVDVGGAGSRTIRTEKKAGKTAQSPGIQWTVADVRVNCKE
jgi:hypothetical protein